VNKRQSSAADVALDAIARLEKWRRGGTGEMVASSFAGTLSSAEIAGMIDHTLLKPDATAAQIRRLCSEAALYGFASVCVNSGWVPLCYEELSGTDVMVCTVVGFPLGACMPVVKRYEAEQAIEAGASEVDMVIAVGRLKGGDYAYVHDDIAAIVEASHPRGVKVKTIIETCLLTDEEKAVASALAQAAGADFVKTSSGFSGPGANVQDVALMRALVGPRMGVKAAGGVRTLDDLQKMAAAGATRIGASAGVQIMQGLAEGRELGGAQNAAPDKPEGALY